VVCEIFVLVHEQPGKEGGWYSVLIIAKFVGDVGIKISTVWDCRDSIAVYNKSSRLV